MLFESLSFPHPRTVRNFALSGKQKNPPYLQKLESTKGGRKYKSAIPFQ